MVDLGTDVSTFREMPDGTWRVGLDTTFSTMSGTRVVGEAIARRLITPRGTFSYDPEYGLDLRSYLNDDLGPTDLYALSSLIEAEAEKDERVLSADVSVSLDSQTSRMNVRINLTLLDSTQYDLTLAIEALTVAILRAS